MKNKSPLSLVFFALMISMIEHTLYEMVSWFDKHVKGIQAAK